jgi:hypothetical protein
MGCNDPFISPGAFRPCMFRRADVAERDGWRVHERWTQLRFSVVGQLPASPPAKGALRAALEELAAHEWRHPSTGEPVRFGVSSLERWFYCARNEQHDPVSVLRRKRHQDAIAPAAWIRRTHPACGSAPGCRHR